MNIVNKCFSENIQSEMPTIETMLFKKILEETLKQFAILNIHYYTLII